LNSAAPGGDRAGAADDGVVRINSERREERVHRAAEPAVEPVSRAKISL
jgi:hypothetical protein